MLLATLADYTDLAQAIITGLAVAAAGVWALHRWRFPEAGDPDLSIALIDGLPSLDLESLILRFRLTNPYRVAIHTGRWGYDVFHIGETPIIAVVGEVDVARILQAPGAFAESQDSLDLRPREELTLSYPIDRSFLLNASHLSLLVAFEHVEWRRSLFLPWRARRNANFYQETIVEIPEEMLLDEDAFAPSENGGASGSESSEPEPPEEPQDLDRV